MASSSTTAYYSSSARVQRYECVWHIAGIIAAKKRLGQSHSSSIVIDNVTDAEGRKHNTNLMMRLQLEGNSDNVTIFAHLSTLSNFLTRMRLVLLDGNDGSDKGEIFGLKFEFDRYLERSFFKNVDGSHFKWARDEDAMVVRVELELTTLTAEKSKLSDDINKLFSSEALSDFTIVCNGKRFPTYKVLLAARCPMFLAMLQTDCKEVKEGKVHIDNYTSEVVALFLAFLLTDKVSEKQLALHAIQLYSMGHQYQVEALRNISRDYLAYNLSPENWFDILDLAEKYEDQKLFSVVVKELMWNKEAVMESEVWKNLGKEIITKLMMASMTKRVPREFLNIA